MRAALEGLAVAEIIASPGADAAVATLREALSQLADSDGDFAAKLEADLGFHLLLCRLSGNAMLVEAWRYLEGRIRVTIMNCETDRGAPTMMARTGTPRSSTRSSAATWRPRRRSSSSTWRRRPSSTPPDDELTSGRSAPQPARAPRAVARLIGADVLAASTACPASGLTGPYDRRHSDAIRAAIRVSPHGALTPTPPCLTLLLNGRLLTVNCWG